MNARATLPLLLGVLTGALTPAPAAAQEGPDAGEGDPIDVERVYVPEDGFDRVLERHPRGVVVREAELRELLRRAGLEPPPVEAPAEGPLEASLERVDLTGDVVDGVATLVARAEVTVLSPEAVALRLPLDGIGLRRVTVDGAPARVLDTRQGPAILLEGAPVADGTAVPTPRVVSWELAVRVEPGEERGSGSLTVPVPAAAAGRVRIELPGDVDVSAGGGLAWVESSTGDRTIAGGAFGGLVSADERLRLAWAPRRAVVEVRPYAVADARSLFLVRQGVVTLESTVLVGVYRAKRSAFQLDLPPGFVVRDLDVRPGEATYVQKGDRVEVRLDVPRQDRLDVRLRAELATGAGGDTEQLALRPLGFPDLDRVSGILGVAHGPGTVVRFGAVSGLERADLAALGASGATDRLLRVYRRGEAAAALDLSAAPLEAEVDLGLLAAFQLEEREIKALAAYRFRVDEGEVFSVTAELPAGFALERLVVRDGDRREPPHQLKETTTAGPAGDATTLTIDLPRGLKAGDELLLTVEARRDEPEGLAGRTLAVPRFAGSPATTLHGYVGFAPDESFRVAGGDLTALTAIPAAELPKAGLNVGGLVLGYRLEEADYAGAVQIKRRETRVSAETLTRQRVRERVVETEAALALTIEGAPVSSLELLLPAGVGRLARITAPGLLEDRELLGTADDGRERWRLAFERRQTGSLVLRVQFETVLPASGEDEVEVAALPQVSLGDAFRERGTLAVYSSDATELSAAPRGVRPIEVTEVPTALLDAGDEDGDGPGRPLFAFTTVGQDWELGLTIRRRDTAPVLSAVCEVLDLRSTASADGTSRHTATFTLKNLNNQFFALRLPDGARLWSVVVDGEGVKPAERGGLQIVPIPTAGTKGPDEETQVEATYTMDRDAWGAVGSVGLVAPELVLRDDAEVPVLKTVWRVALPHDYRVLEYSGNVAGSEAAAPAPLAVAGWHRLRDDRAPWVLGLLALIGVLVSLSPRARRALLVGAEAADRGARSSGRVARTAATSRQVWVVVGGGAAIVLLAGCLWSLVTATGADRTVRTEVADGYAGGADSDGGEEAWATTDSEGRSPAPSASAPGGGGGDAGAAWGAEAREKDKKAEAATAAPPAPAAPPPPPARPAEEAEESLRRLEEEVESLAQEQQRQRERRADSNAEPAPEAEADAEAEPMPADAPMAGEDADDAVARDELMDEEAARNFDDDRRNRGRPARRAGRLAPDAVEGAAEQGAGPPANQPGPARTPATADAPAPEPSPSPEAKTVAAQAGGPELGRVGLRSLVLDLALVGREATFERPGGGARVDVRFAKESVLTFWGGLLAFGTFLAAFLVPWRLRVSYGTLLVLGLAALTALPFVALGSEATPFLNAVAVGLVLAAPIHVLVGVGRFLQTRPLHRLGRAIRELRAERQPAAPRRTPAGAGAAGAAVVLLGLFGFAAPASAQEAEGDDPPRVYVPYDPADPEAPTERVYVPGELYESLWQRAFPERVEPAAPKPPVAAAITDVLYSGEVTAEGLDLRAELTVDVLARGWQRVSLGLSGTGLEESAVTATSGGGPDARVVPAAAGGFDLVATGPGVYRVTLDLVAPRTGGGYAFATAPAAAARVVLSTPLTDRRIVVGGARAQRERTLAGGRVEVDASLGDARRVTISLPAREVLTTGGASEASADTAALVWVRRGRVLVLSDTTFAIAGAGREGFVFDVPADLEVIRVETPGLRAWHVEDGRLEVALRRPSGGRARVRIVGERLLPATTGRFTAPELVARGVSRESGVVGLAVAEGLRVRTHTDLRQVDARRVRALAQALRVGSVESAFGFARRPATLEVETVREPVELKADTVVRGVVGAERLRVEATVRYDVRRGRAYELRVAVPAELTLAAEPRGLDVREVSAAVAGDRKVLTFGLASGLTGSGTLELVLARAHAPAERLELPFPDVRPLGVAAETTEVALAAPAGLDLRVPRDLAGGLGSRDVRSATRGWRPAEGGAEWRLAYRRSNGRSPGLAAAPVTVTRPEARVTGSWVLHARVERDVVRYVLRALYEIESSGARRFEVLLPERVGDRVTVDAPNVREVTNRAAPGGRRRVTVELQSPAEAFYELALEWEEVLAADARIALPRVALAGVDRQFRGYVLVEKAADVPDLLREVETAGPVETGRAADAPALPPGKGPNDFAFVYRVSLKDAAEDWSIACRLEAPGDRTEPVPARIPWAHVTSVFTTEGVVRNRVVYRVRNLRLQFLTIRLPKVDVDGTAVPADVWSVFVAGAPKRLHREGDLLLIPLPKRTDADLSFDVEVIYATPLPGEFGFGGAFRPQAPDLETEKVQVEQTFWTLYLPADYEYGDFEGDLERSTSLEASVEALEGHLDELRRLEQLARAGSGNAQRVADENIDEQRRRIADQLRTLQVQRGEPAPDARQRLAQYKEDLSALDRTIAERRDEAASKARAQGPAGAEEVVVEGQDFDQLDSGWYSNRAQFRKGNAVQWTGVQTEQTEGDADAGDGWSLNVPEGLDLDLDNAEVFYDTRPGQQGQQGGKRLLGNRGYDRGLRQAEAETRRQQQQEDLQRVLLGQEAREANELAREDADQLGLLSFKEEAAAGDTSTQGLMSIRVRFETPGRAFHFASTGPEDAPELAFTAYPAGTSARAARIARGVVLLVLLIGLLRLGILRPAREGRRALQALLLTGAGLLAVGVFWGVVTAALALIAGLVAIRQGDLGLSEGAAEAAPAREPAAAA